ncbi:DUF6495 family protein [Bacteroidia bacterium]|nr:DUF6495 family protein [Bacteroidia bacterium]MDB9882729.1 DUF6495 family protein [Bacteroidia bacterium]
MRYKISNFASMNYTRIPKDELEELKQEFINFLVVNGITADDWVFIKENEPVNADEIINQFSDVVWESVLRSTEYLNKVESDTAYYFKCDAEEIHLIRIVKTTTVTEQHITSKKYSKTRELELFQMIQNGCAIADGKDYKALE